MRTYLDHNATSPLRPEAREAMTAMLAHCGNASSVHEEGRAAHGHLDGAREALASSLGALANMVVFTSGGSEANNLAVKGAAVERLIISSIEHPSVIEAAKATGKPVALIPVGKDGVADLDALRLMLPGPKALVSLMLANNETGVIQPVREAAVLAAGHQAIFHVDAVQAVGKVPVNFGLIGCDLMSVSAHKFGGPLGVGALIVRDGVKLAPLIHGGSQELRRRAGTENLMGIAGFAAALGQPLEGVAALRDRLEAGLDDAIIFGSDVPRLPNTTCFAVPGMNAETLLIAFDLAGIAVSSGSACSSGKVARSHVLSAMGLAPEYSMAAIRVSLGWTTTAEDVDRFITAWKAIRARHKARQAA